MDVELPAGYEVADTSRHIIRLWAEWDAGHHGDAGHLDVVQVTAGSVASRLQRIAKEQFRKQA